MKNNVDNLTLELIQTIKACGKDLIENADKIANDFKYQTDLYIKIYIDFYEHKIPEIEVTTHFIPSDCMNVMFVNPLMGSEGMHA